MYLLLFLNRPGFGDIWKYHWWNYYFSAWQRWINRVAITTNCCCTNETDSKLPSTKLAYSFVCNIFSTSQQPNRFKKNQTHQIFLFVKGYFL